MALERAAAAAGAGCHWISVIFYTMEGWRKVLEWRVERNLVLKHAEKEPICLR
jgi:hypothetical protein